MLAFMLPNKINTSRNAKETAPILKGDQVRPELQHTQKRWVKKYNFKNTS